MKKETIELTNTKTKTEEIIIPEKSSLKIKVIEGNARLHLFLPHSFIPHRTMPLFIPAVQNSYCFAELVSGYHHFVIERDLVDTKIIYELGEINNTIS